MLVCVTFVHVEVSSEPGRLCGRRRRWSLKPVFYPVLRLCDCVGVSVDLCYSPIIMYAVCLKLCGHRRQNVPGDDII